MLSLAADAKCLNCTTFLVTTRRWWEVGDVLSEAQYLLCFSLPGGALGYPAKPRSLYWGEEFLDFQKLVSQTFPFTPKWTKQFHHSLSIYVRNISQKYEKLRQITIGAQQNTSRHNRNSNKSQLVLLRYSFPVFRKLRRNCFDHAKSRKGAEFAFSTLNSTKSRPQPFCAE